MLKAQLPREFQAPGGLFSPHFSQRPGANESEHTALSRYLLALSRQEEADDFIPTRAVAVDSFPQTVHVEAKPRRRGARSRRGVKEVDGAHTLGKSPSTLGVQARL